MEDTLHTKPSFAPRDVHLQENLDEAAKAILNRPLISIRLRFVVSLGVCFLLCSVLALIALGLLGKIRTRLQVLAAAEKLSFQIQEVRGHERIYLQSGKDPEHTLDCR